MNCYTGQQVHNTSEQLLTVHSPVKSQIPIIVVTAMVIIQISD